MTTVRQSPGRFAVTCLYATAFVSGFVVLSLEVLGFRLFAPYFGYSAYVSGSLITMVLVAITAGCYLGGIVADRRPSLDTLYLIILAAAAYLILVTLGYRLVLPRFAEMSPVIGTVGATLVVFAPPMLLLSMASPFIAKVLLQSAPVQRAGQVVGSISAISTIGSIAGSAFTTFVLIPGAGSRTSLVICDLTLCAVALAFLLTRGKGFWPAALVPALLLTSYLVPAEREKDLVFETESVYNLIKVRRSGDQYVLQLNDDKNRQSVFSATYGEGDVFSGSYADVLNAGPVIAGGRDVLILGLGGGTSANQMRLLFNANVDAVEIDPAVADVATRYFHIKRVNPDLRIHLADARTFLRSSHRMFDVVEVDMYQGGLYMPFYVATREFFADVKARLRGNGVMVMNVLADNVQPGGDQLYRAVGNTIASVYDSVFCVKTTQFPANVLFFALKEPAGLAAVKKRLLDSPYAGPDTARTFPRFVADNLSSYTPDRSTPAFTDDRAPIERLTYQVVRQLLSYSARKQG